MGLHFIGYVANISDEATSDFYPDYAETFTKIGRERGWPPVRRPQFDAQVDPKGRC